MVAASDFNVPFEALADRTAWLRSKVWSRKIWLTVASADGSVWTGDVGSYSHADVSFASALRFFFSDLPVGARFTGITAYVDSYPVHSDLPETMPYVSLVRYSSGHHNFGGAVASQTDPSASLAEYEVEHTIDVTVDETIQDALYSVKVTGELGTNAIDNAFSVLSIEVTIEP
jgi:hypothetical protein